MVECIYKSPRGDVHYLKSEKFEEGQKTLVFLHGLTADHRLFNGQVPYFDGKYKIIVWDAPAHGMSRPYNDFSYPNAAEDLNSILIENKIETAVFIGQSMGGFVMQSFLLRHAEKMSAAVFIDSCPFGNYYSNSDKWWLRQIEWMSKLFTYKTLKKSVAHQCALTQHARNNMLSMLELYEKDELCHLMGIGFAGFLEDNQQLRINCPSLLLLGEHDITGKVKSYNREWTKNTGFPLHVIPNAAHNSNDDNPDAVNREIETFLKSIE